jgi:ribonuclease HI
MKISVSVDGACRSNGQENAIASIGVYFEHHTDHNLSQVLRILQPTNQKAELIAAIRGLEQSYLIANHMGMNHKMSKNSGEPSIELQCDSAYVVRGILEWTPIWKANGYKNSKGRPVANAKLFQHLDELVTKAIPAMKWRVYLKHVPRKENSQADALVNMAIDLKMQSGLGDPLLGTWIVSNMPSQHICHMRELFTNFTGCIPLS